MKRFNQKAKLFGNAVIFGTGNGHLVMFHDVRRWDDDAKNKLGLKSGREKKFSTDLGPCLEEYPSRQFVIDACQAKFGLTPEFVGVEAETKPEQTTAKPEPWHKLQRKPQTTAKPEQTEQKPFSASAYKPTCNSNTAQDAITAIFGGMQQEITHNVLTAIEPYVNSVKKTELIVKSANGIHQTEGIFHEKFAKILYYVNNGEHVYMFGPSGSGKSYMAKQIADALGLDFYEQQRVTHDYQLLGWPTADGGYAETPFFQAFTKGGVFAWDECDASCPESGLALNGALEQGRCVFNGKCYEQHPNFRVIASGNTNGQGATEEFVGRYCQDAAFLDRLMKVKVGYCAELERGLCNNDMDIIDFVRSLRKVRDDKQITLTIGNRLIKRMFKFKDCEFGKADVLEDSLMNDLDTDTAKILLNSLPDYGTSWYKAAKELAKRL